MYEANQSCKGSDDVCAAGRKPALVCARLEPQPPAESSMASACAVSWRAPVVLTCGCVDYRNLAPLATVAGAAGGVSSSGSVVGCLLDTAVLHPTCFTVFNVVGRKTR